MVAPSSLRVPWVVLTALSSVLVGNTVSKPTPAEHKQLPLSLLSSSASSQHDVHPSIQSALATHDDPVDALLMLKPELGDMMAEARLIWVFDEDDKDGRWMTEGDKLRLRKEGRDFMDLTENQDKWDASLFAGHANTPNITHQRYIRPIFSDLSTSKMHDVLTVMTSFYNRYYYSESGVASARWLHDHISSIIASSPMSTYISLEYHTHRFPQPSIIARFEPVTRNASLPLTIIGAHQDSANYLFPLLPAPGADDDMSGSTSILEAFRVLALRGYIPETGPVEFHWYAAEEAGLLGSQEIVAYKKEIGAKVGAMIEFDMTAFVARNTTPHIVLLENDADASLTKWVVDLAKEYADIPVDTAELPADAGSDYMSWNRAGYPAAFAAEGDPTKDMGGDGLGEFEPYVHTDRDRMDINDESGVFSLEHMLEFSKLAIAFAVEQAGWSAQHTRKEDSKKSAW